MGLSIPLNIDSGAIEGLCLPNAYVIWAIALLSEVWRYFFSFCDEPEVIKSKWHHQTKHVPACTHVRVEDDEKILKSQTGSC